MLKKGISLLLVFAILLLPSCGKKDEPVTMLDAAYDVTKEASSQNDVTEDTTAESENNVERVTFATGETVQDNMDVATATTEIPDTTEAASKVENKEDGSVEDVFFGNDQNTPDAPASEVVTPDPSAPTVAANGSLTEYERFLNMSPADQQAYMESFDSIEAFFTWYNAEKEKYDAEHPPIEIDGGVIDLDKIING